MEDFVSTPWLRRLLTVVLLAGIVLLGFRVLEPFIVPLVWAAILAFVTWPAYQRLLRACGGRPLPAALLMTSAVSIAVVAPLAWVAAVLRVELIHAWHETQALLAGGLELPPAIARLPWIGEPLRDLVARAAQDPHALGAEVSKVTNQSFDQIAHVIGNIAHNVVKLLLAVLSLFFVYRDGERLTGQLAWALEQLLGPRVHNYLRACAQTVKAVVYGLVLAAVVQGVLVGLGYWVAGAGSPVFLAALTTVCGLIPFAAPARGRAASSCGCSSPATPWRPSAWPSGAASSWAGPTTSPARSSSASRRASPSWWCCSGCWGDSRPSGWSACSSVP